MVPDKAYFFFPQKNIIVCCGFSWEPLAKALLMNTHIICFCQGICNEIKMCCELILKEISMSAHNIIYFYGKEIRIFLDYPSYL